MFSFIRFCAPFLTCASSLISYTQKKLRELSYMKDRQALFDQLMDFLQSAPAPPDYLAQEPETASDFDPYQMVAEWTALRHEIKQQGKLSQASQVTLQQTLRELQAEKAHWQQQLEENQQRNLAEAEKEQKALLRELLGVLDALERAGSHWQQQLESLAKFPPSKPLSLWQRWQRCFSRRRGKARETILPASSWRDTLISNQEGVALIQRSLLDILRQRQVVAIEAQGCPFDPQTMYAIGRQESGAVAPNTVIQEVVRGYLWRGQILREAQVIVSARKQEE
jgi:molecular chaperone GrpE